MRIRGLLIILILLLVVPVCPETVVLTNGETIEGEITGINDQKVQININGSVINVSLDKVANLDDLTSNLQTKPEPEKAKASQLPIITVAPSTKGKEDWPENPSLAYWPVAEQKKAPTASPEPATKNSIPPARVVSSKDQLPNLFGQQPGQARPTEVANLPGLFTIALNKTSGQAVASQSAANPASPVKAELRGVWVTRFEWPSRDPQIMKEKLVEIMDILAQANFNAVFLQVRGQGDVLYRSPFEPWSPLINSKEPGFDPLDFAIEEAHKRGLELHAYVNPIPIWQGEEMPPKTNPPHPFSIYGQAGSPQNWLCCDEQGEPMSSSTRTDRYIYLSPGIPEVQDYVRKIIIDIVKRYEVDGIHLDRIRYPGRQFSHDPVSKNRFQNQGNPNQLNWTDWQREQLNRLVYNLYAEIIAVNPKVKVSSAVWGIYSKYRIPGYQGFSSGYHDYYQDSWAWVKQGAMDAVVPMIYWDIGGRKPDYDELLSDFTNNLPERHVYGGLGSGHIGNIKELEAEITFTRTHNGQGTVIFAWDRVKENDYWKQIKAQVYKDEVAVPDMPWKRQPTQGIIIGYVHDQQGQPVVDALLNLSGRDDNWLSTANGFFSMLKVVPGDNYQLKVSKKGFAPATYGPIKVEAGEVKQFKLTLKPSSS